MGNGLPLPTRKCSFYLKNKYLLTYLLRFQQYFIYLNNFISKGRYKKGYYKLLLRGDAELFIHTRQKAVVLAIVYLSIVHETFPRPTDVIV